MRLRSRVVGAVLGGLTVFGLSIGLILPTPGAQAQGRHAKISVEKAKSAALKKYPGKVEGKINLENEEGSWQYAVNVRSGKTLREVMVNANTGKIASVEVTSKAEEAKEQKADAAKMHHGHQVKPQK